MRKSGEEFQLITSVLSITEVAYATYEKDNATLDVDTEAKIAKLWQAGSPIKIVEFYDLIAVRAQKLMRAALANKWSLKPADAIHLATADQLKVSEFHTYDRALEKFSGLTETKFPIIAPISDTPHLLLLAVFPDVLPETEQREALPEQPKTGKPQPPTAPTAL